MKARYRLIDGQWQPIRSVRKPHFRLVDGSPMLVRPVRSGKEIDEQQAALLIKQHHQHISAFADFMRIPRQSVYAALSRYHERDGGYVRRARLALGLKSEPTQQAMNQAWVKASRRTNWTATT